jgi:hypothetical protein
VQVVREVVNLVTVHDPWVLLATLTLALNGTLFPNKITVVVFLDLGLELLPVPIRVLESAGAVTSVEARDVLSKRVGESLVVSELGSLLDTEASAGSVQGRHEVVIQDHTRERQHVLLGDTNIGVTVLLSPEVRNVVNLAINSNPKSVLIFCVTCELLDVPCLVGVGAQKLSKPNNPEDNQTVDEDDQEEQNKLFTPSHTNIRSSHASNKLEKR